MTQESYQEQDNRRSAPDPVDVYVGKRLRTKRKYKRMSQEQLARAVGVTFQQIQKYERGSNRISASRLYDIARILEEPISYFFEHIESEIPPRDGTPPGPNDPREPYTPSPPDSLTNDELALITAYNRLPEDIQRKALTLLKSMAGLKDKKGEFLPDED